MYFRRRSEKIVIKWSKANKTMQNPTQMCGTFLPVSRLVSFHLFLKIKWTQQCYNPWVIFTQKENITFWVKITQALVKTVKTQKWLMGIKPFLSRFTFDWIWVISTQKWVIFDERVHLQLFGWRSGQRAKLVVEKFTRNVI